jgi:hypothetical protein
MYATSPAYHTLHYLLIPPTFDERVSHCSSSLCFCICQFLGPDIFPHSYSRTFSAWDFTQCDRPSSTPIQNKTQHTSLFNFWGSRWSDRTFWAKWQHVFPQFNLLLLFFVHAILICQCLFQISCLCHTFKLLACYLYAVILSHSLLSRYGHRTTRSSLGIYF